MKSRPLTPDDKLTVPDGWRAVSFSAPGTVAITGVTIPKTIKILAVAPAETITRMESATPDQLLAVLTAGDGRLQALPNRATGELIPSVFAVYPDNSALYQFHANGKLHREDGEPAEVVQSGDGTVVKHRFFKQGVLHRDDENPAEIHYFAKSGAKSREDFYKDGVRHRENGPASIGYTQDGKVVSETHYVNGTYVPPEPDHTQTEVYEFSPVESPKVESKPSEETKGLELSRPVAPPAPMPKAPPVVLPAAPAVPQEALEAPADQMALF